MAIYEGDQQTTAVGVINGVHTSMTAAVMKSIAPAGVSTYTFTKSYTFHNPVPNGQPLDFRRGVSYHLDATLKAALLAASAPMVAA